jgi:tetratricopeptide (TPR) repeat protein
MSIATAERSRGLTRIVILGLCMAGLVAASAGAEPVSIEYHMSSDALRIVLSWPHLPQYADEARGRELLLRFSRPIEAPEVLALPRQAPEWVLNVRTGYDSLLIHAAQDVAYTIDAEEKAIVITMRQAPQSPGAVEKEDADTERTKENEHLRAELLRARALFESGALAQARVILQQLIEEHAESVEPLVNLAELEARAGRWRKAVTLYNRALHLVNDPRIVRAKAQLLAQHGPFVQTDVGVQHYQDADTQTFLTATGRLLSSQWTDAGFEYQTRYVDAPSVARPDGDTSGFSGVRHRLELNLSGEFDNGIDLAGRLYATEYHVGVGVDLNGEIGQGRWALAGRYHEPYWVLLEGVVSGGAADRLSIEYAGRVKRDFSILAKMGVNAYSIGDEFHGAKSGTGTFAIRYAPPLHVGGLSLGYIFDGEFPFDLTTKTDADGMAFHPVNVLRREVHTMELSYIREVTDALTVAGTFVYSYDRVGGQGPGGHAALTYKPSLPWEFGIRGSISSVSLRGGSDDLFAIMLLYAKLRL